MIFKLKQNNFQIWLLFEYIELIWELCVGLFCLKIFPKYINYITLKTFCKENFFLVKIEFKAKMKNMRKQGKNRGLRSCSLWSPDDRRHGSGRPDRRGWKFKRYFFSPFWNIFISLNPKQRRKYSPNPPILPKHSPTPIKLHQIPPTSQYIKTPLFVDDFGVVFEEEGDGSQGFFKGTKRRRKFFQVRYD